MKGSSSMLLVAVIACMMSGVALVLLAVVLMSGDSTSAPTPTSAPGHSGMRPDPYEGLPTAPPADLVAFYESIKWAFSRSVVKDVNPVSAVFYTKSDCWSINYLFRVTSMELLRSFMNMNREAMKLKKNDKNAARDMDQKILQELQKFARSMMAELKKCDPPASITMYDGERMTAGQAIAQLNTSGLL